MGMDCFLLLPEPRSCLTDLTGGANYFLMAAFVFSSSKSVDFYLLFAGRMAFLGLNALLTGAGFEVGATDQVDAVGHGGKNAVHGLAAVSLPSDLPGFRQSPWAASRQVDDQVLQDHGHLARQDGGGHKGQADLAHLLTKARHLFVGHGQRGFGVTVSRSAGPVPLQVSTRLHLASSTSSVRVALMVACSSGISRASNVMGLSRARLASLSARAGPCLRTRRCWPGR